MVHECEFRGSAYRIKPFLIHKRVIFNHSKVNMYINNISTMEVSLTWPGKHHTALTLTLYQLRYRSYHIHAFTVDYIEAAICYYAAYCIITAIS